MKLVESFSNTLFQTAVFPLRLASIWSVFKATHTRTVERIGFLSLYFLWNFPFFLQAFVRDPDGYYIEFCNCQLLDNYLEHKSTKTDNFGVSQNTRAIFREMVLKSKQLVAKRKSQLRIEVRSRDEREKSEHTTRINSTVVCAGNL